MIILAIIPARGGSKGIKDKNIAPLAGKPLIAHTIEAALQCNALDDVIVSTDSEKIAECATNYGVDVHALRPAWLAGDEAKSIDVIHYEVDQFEQRNQITIDAVLLLQPTTPLRTVDDIQQSIEIFETCGARSLISCYNATHVHPKIMYTLHEDTFIPYLNNESVGLRRQEFEDVYVRNGAIYISKRDLVMNEGRVVCDAPAAYIMPRERSINIDEPFDLEWAEWALSRLDQKF